MLENDRIAELGLRIVVCPRADSSCKPNEFSRKRYTVASQNLITDYTPVLESCYQKSAKLAFLNSKCSYSTLAYVKKQLT